MNLKQKNSELISGDKDSFKKSWKIREEKTYNHWTRERPQNQVQLAFRMHWKVFQKLMENKLFKKGKKCLDVGCGRGVMSAYFSDAGFDCTLLDISADVIKIAKNIFNENGLKADYEVGDANKLPFDNNSFDVVFSMGLLEHFEDIKTPIKEQVRILNKGGLFMGYVVPRNTESVQKDYDWVNDILREYKNQSEKLLPKERLYRSDQGSANYLKIMRKEGLRNIKAKGIYPLPMISHSIEFPFSLMPSKAEKIIVKHFMRVLKDRKNNSKELHPWLCEEGYGKAFLIWGYKR